MCTVNEAHVFVVKNEPWVLVILSAMTDLHISVRLPVDYSNEESACYRIGCNPFSPGSSCADGALHWPTGVDKAEAMLATGMVALGPREVIHIPESLEGERIVADHEIKGRKIGKVVPGIDDNLHCLIFR